MMTVHLPRAGMGVPSHAEENRPREGVFNDTGPRAADFHIFSKCLGVRI